MCVCAQVVEALSLKYWSNVWILYSFFDESYADPKVHTCTRDMHLPPYTHRHQITDRLHKLLEHSDGGFNKE